MAGRGMPRPRENADPRNHKDEEGRFAASRMAERSAGRTERPKRRRKRVRLGDAMRRVGLDERAIAENYAGVVEKLTNGRQQPNDGAEKLLVEVLKEFTRVLEPPLRAGGGGGDAPVIVQLMHNVPRPSREAADAGHDAARNCAADARGGA